MGGLRARGNVAGLFSISASRDFQFCDIVFCLVEGGGDRYGKTPTPQSYILTEESGLRRGAKRNDGTASILNAAEEHAEWNTFGITGSDEHSGELNVG